MRAFIALCLGLAMAVHAGAQTLGGKSLRVHAGDRDRAWAPVSVAVSEDDGVVYLKRVNGEGVYPATVRNGVLTFVVDSLKRGESADFVAGEGGRPGVALAKRGDEPIVDVQISGAAVTAYHYSAEWKKPFLWPVTDKQGMALTRAWPMGAKDQTSDHPHQKSLWTAYGDINGVDCWAEGENSGRQVVEDVQFSETSGGYGWIVSKNVWTDAAGKPVIRETREYRFYAGGGDHWIVDVDVTFSAEYGDAKFGDTKEGGLVSLRMHEAMRETGGTGKITTAAGLTGMREAWGKPAAWCDYSGTLEGAGRRGIAVMDHPGNLRHPTSWHVRDYGLMGANCFGYSYFTNGAENGDWLLPAGESKTFRYRVYVHTGDAEAADVAGAYENFANPPRAEWIE